MEGVERGSLGDKVQYHNTHLDTVRYEGLDTTATGFPNSSLQQIEHRSDPIVAK